MPRPNSPVNARYGAPMGRMNERGDLDTPARFNLLRVRLCGDYDAGGAYWGGGGQPLYYYECNNSQASGYLRANTREQAKDRVRDTYPNAKFYR